MCGQEEEIKKAKSPSTKNTKESIRGSQWVSGGGGTWVSAGQKTLLPWTVIFRKMNSFWKLFHLNIILPRTIYCEWTHLLRWWANDYYYGSGPLLIYVSIFRATDTHFCSLFHYGAHGPSPGSYTFSTKIFTRIEEEQKCSNKSWKEFFHLFLFDIILLHCFFSWPGVWLAVTFSLLIYYV